MRCFLFLLSLVPVIGHAQAMRDINFGYLYSDDQPFELKMQPIRGETQWKVYFVLNSRDSSIDASAMMIGWQLRSSVGDPSGVELPSDSSRLNSSTKSTLTGIIGVPISSQVQYLVAKVITADRKRLTYFFCVLEPNYPQKEILRSAGNPVVAGYANVDDDISIENNGSYIVSYYNDVFPTAPPPFSESLGKVSRGMVVDSIFTLNGGQQARFVKPGLYLIQKDTLAAEGTSVRIEDDYPRLAKLRTIADPLVYICTSAEFARIKAAKGDKKAFDKVILSITKNSERAKSMMRSYFQRVEMANKLFTSYKEGWKTDRGMVYIIFGIPDEVSMRSDSEEWSYKNSEYKLNFSFVRSPSLFDPETFVLVRDRKFSEAWYEVVDLWRNARF